MKIVYSAPLNSLSMGNVSFNFLREFYRKGVDVNFFPIGSKVEAEVFADQIDDNFREWLSDAINSRFEGLTRDLPTLKLWHLNGSEQKYTDNQYLYTFYEMDEPTKEEVTLANLQSKTFFSSNYATSRFEDFGVNAEAVPLGFDRAFHETDKLYMDKNIVHFGLMGKWEKRKHTAEIIKLWAKKYGNNPNYRLTCCVINPFYQGDQMKQVIAQALGGQSYFNINFLNFLSTNVEVNDYLNSINIDLSGLSGSEGWGLPSFNATALGKWSVVLNATAHKDWANEENSILIRPNGKIPAYDNIFFKKGQAFNQGSIYTWSEEEAVAGIEAAVKKVKDGVKNEEGLKLQNQFSYTKTVDKILNSMKG